MEAHQPVRDELIRAAEEAHLIITEELDNLFEAISVYLDVNPVLTVGDLVRSTELQISVRELGTLPSTIAREVAGWKKGEDPVWSPLGLEVHILNEIWAHAEAICLFLTVNDSVTEPFHRRRLLTALQTLKVVSRRLAQPAKG